MKACELYGRDISDEHRAKMDEADFAGKGRSYPIEEPEDVHNAAQSIGRAGEDNYSAEELKARIIAIAKRKGKEFEARLPEAWRTVKGADEAPRIAILIGAAAGMAVNGLHRIPVAIVTRAIFKGKQKYSVTAADVRDIVANFRKRQTDVIVDYEHSTLAAGGTPTPSAGWLKAVDDGPDKDGVLWGWAEYTESGARAVAAKDYKYVSPVIEWGKRDKATGEAQGATVTSIALVKQPLFESLPELPLVASDSDGWSFSRGDVVEVKEERNVKITKVIAGAAGKVRLVADDSTESEFAIEGAAAVLTMADVKRTSDGKWDFSKLGQNKEALIATEVLRAMDVQELIDRALEAGKITPAQRGFYETAGLADVTGLQTLIGSMGTAVDFREHGTGADARQLPRNLAQIESQVDELVAKKLAANAKLSYGQALKLVASENKPLFRQRETLIAQEER